MPIREHPSPGTVLLCNFDERHFAPPEMVKRRPVVVLSPKIAARPGLCTVVSLSRTAPDPVQPFHCQLTLDPPLPPPWDGEPRWVKGDMLFSVGFARLDLIRLGKTKGGRRIYRYDVLSTDQMRDVHRAVLAGIGLSRLTRHL